MAVEDARVIECPYLPGRQMKLEAGISLGLAHDRFDALLARGYRRSGPLIYRPDCPAGCRECRPIRVPVASFTATRSQRRLLARVGPSVEVQLLEPRFRPAYLELHNRHALRVSSDNRLCSPAEYYLAFVESCVDTRTVEYRVQGKLVGVGTIDVGQQSLSSVYFCWDPDYARLSLGTYSGLWELSWAAERGLRYYYLGYLVAGCSSMAYKSRFRPCELFDWEARVWRPAPGEAGDVGAA